MTTTIAEAARHYAARDLGRAALACLDIIREDPAHYDALHLLGVICTNRGQHADGLSYLLRAEAVRSDEAMLQANLGAAYGAVQRFDKAVEAYQKALALNRRNAGVLNNLGLAQQGLGLRDEALETFRTANETDPANDPVLYNLARCKIACGSLAEAEADLRVLVARLPAGTSQERTEEVTNQLARVIADQGRAPEALQILRDAIAKHPEMVLFRWNAAMLLLLLGRFEEGWLTYETRWLPPNHEAPPADYSVLDPAKLAGLRVLVREEQGRGDVIQFLRYIKPLAACGARICLSVYHDLIPLAREMPEVELVLGPGHEETEYDLLTTIMSLPLAFATNLETIPAEVPYLRVPADRVARMKHNLGPASMPRIGLVWSGSAVSRARSAIPLAALEPLLSRSGVEFHCLQKEISPEDRDRLGRTVPVTTHAEMLRDFGDTAALIDAMDLVISIDTAVAHLAGALAKPVWIMLAFNPDWRWLLSRDDSPWYPTATLFRQKSPGDWDSVGRSVAAALPF
jgi:tetratricopeptide (TPR) repeat protein